jgi:hypothetical protein
VIVTEIIRRLQIKLLKDFVVSVRLITLFRYVDSLKLNGSAKKCLLAILMATLTAACSSLLFKGEVTPAPIAMPTDYRMIVSKGAPAQMTKKAEVSELRESSGAQFGDWMTCVKSDTSPYIGFFAVFIQDGKVKGFRRSIGIDQCESAMYSPLPPAAFSTQETNESRKRNKVDSSSRPSKSAN